MAIAIEEWSPLVVSWCVVMRGGYIVELFRMMVY